MNPQQQQIFQNQPVVRLQTNTGLINSGFGMRNSVPQQQQLQQQQQLPPPTPPQAQRQSINSQYDYVSSETYNQIKINKSLSIFLLCVSIAISIYFYVITKDFNNIDDCKKLYIASEVNEYVWYYSIFVYFYYLTLAIGANHWKCYAFQLDLPKIYKSINGLVMICVLGSTIALQICLNYQESCGNLVDQVRGYLALSYIVLVILIVYFTFSGKKQSTQSGAIQQPSTQQQFTYNENQRLTNQNQNNYSTFNNNL